TLKTPIPPAERPRLKNLACAENRDESGNSLIANGSSNDSSTSRGFKELSHSKGVLDQSNSIGGLIVNQTPMQCNYIVTTLSVIACQSKTRRLEKKVATATVGGHFSKVAPAYSSPPFLPPLVASPSWSMRLINGRNSAMTMLPTTTARKTIMIGSRREVIADTALSTSSS